MMIRLKVRRREETESYRGAHGDFELARLRLADDTGSALVLALAFIVFFAIVMGSVLFFVEASFRSAMAIRDQRKESYSADGAIENAILMAKADQSIGRFGEPCSVTPTTLNGITVDVACEGRPEEFGFPGSGEQIGGGGGAASVPNSAILTLATEGPGIDKGSEGELRVKGDVWSNSNILGHPTGALNVTGSVWARDGCTGLVNATVLKDCATTTVQPDPGYEREAAAVPGPATLPACTGPVIEFNPGRYPSATALNTLMNGCNNRVFLFNPGVYYFDFLDSPALWNLNLTNGVVVAGKPVGWDPNSTTLPTVPFPGGCDKEGTAPGTGVQFIFGGESRMHVQQGQFEICAQAHGGSKQEIAIYGVPAGGGDPQAATKKPTDATSTSQPAFTGTPNALEIDCPHDSANPTTPPCTWSRLTLPGGAGVQIGSIRLTGFGNPTIPSTATILGMTMTVSHRVASAPTSITATVTTADQEATFSSASNPPCGLGGTTGAQSRFQHRQVNLMCLGGLDSDANLNNVTVTYQAQWVHSSQNQPRTIDLDGITIEVSYVDTSLFRAQSGCIISGTTCPLISNGPFALVSIHGTVYAPKSFVNLALQPQTCFQVFDRGVILRSLRVQVTGACDFAGVPISLPESTGGGSTGPRRILFSASIDGRERLRALVSFPVAGAPRIESWRVVR